MKKDQFDRQPDQKPAEPYAGGQGTKGTEPGFKAPNQAEKDKDKLHRKAEQPIGKPGDLDRFDSDSERSDQTSGRPVQLENEDVRPKQGQGDRQQEARRPTGEPMKR